jgi:hypothetical protein
MQRTVAKAPLAIPDHRSDEIGSARHCAHEAGTESGSAPGNSLGCGSDGAGGEMAGAGWEGAGTVSGSTVMRRDGPGIDACGTAPADMTTTECCCTSGLQGE